MLATIGQMLPLVIAGALSSVPVIGVLTLLLGGRGAGPAVLYAAGYTSGVFAVTVVMTAVLGSVVVPALHVRAAPLLGALEMLLGAVSAAAGVVLLRRPAGPDRDGPTGRLTRLLATVRPAVAFAVGALLAFRPKALLLAGGLGIVLGSAHVPSVPAVVLLGGAALVTTSTVSGPVVFALVRADQARAGLEAVRVWMARNARTVTVVVLVLIGTVFFGNGLGRL